MYKNLKRYIYFLLRKYIYKFVLENSVGSDQPIISTEKLKKYIMPLPRFQEQQKIASFFSLLDQKIEKQQEKIEQLELFKKGMMQKIFSQKIRFKDEDGREFPEWEEKSLKVLGDFKNKRKSLLPVKF